MAQLIFFILAFGLLNCNLFSAESPPPNFCSKCDKFREYHRKHPSKYKYYEDYLKDVEKGLVDPNDKPSVYDFLPNEKEETSH